MKVKIFPQTLFGSITAPPSKSFAHRLIIAACLARGGAVIKNAGNSEDVSATVGALSDMGFDCVLKGGNVYIGEKTHKSKAQVFCGESGSTLRFLLPIAAALDIKTEFTGKSGLMKRPVDALIGALNQNGANIVGTKVNGKIKGGTFVIDGSKSSQYVTGLLFALPLLNEDSRIIIKNGSVSEKYVDITLSVLESFKIAVKKTEDGFFVKGGSNYFMPKELNVEGDYSGAAFYLAAGAIGGFVTVKGLKSDTRQGDAAIVDVLKAFGAKMTVESDGVTAEKGELKGVVLDVDVIPDLAQIAAVVACYAKGKTVLKNVGRLRIKESDRVVAITQTLNAAKIKCDLSGNDLIIYGGKPCGAAFTGAYDHRTVMAQTILATFAQGESTVENAQAVNKSYTDFYKDYIKLGGKTNVDV